MASGVSKGRGCRDRRSCGGKIGTPTEWRANPHFGATDGQDRLPGRRTV